MENLHGEVARRVCEEKGEHELSGGGEREDKDGRGVGI